MVDRPVYARVIDTTSAIMERRGISAYRRRLLDGLSGTVLEIGAGNGHNFVHYPDGVRAVTAVEPEPRLRSHAAGAARMVPVPIEVLGGTADALPFADGWFDAAVASLVLCSVSDQRAALAELARVLRPGGELRFLEHVRADAGVRKAAQIVADTTVWPRLLGGCRTRRDTLTEITAAGFRIVRAEHVRFPVPAMVHISDIVIGTAVLTSAVS